MSKRNTQRRPRNKRGRQVGSGQLVAQLAPVIRQLVPRNSGRGIGNARVGTAALPAAYSTHVKSWYKTQNVGKNVIRVSGCDLVYRIPETLASGGQSAFCCIPSNPAYWQGTRIASVASTYSNYRPVQMQFHYVPQVSVNQEGTVVMGTLWNQGSPMQSLQQTLLTSNGGLMCQCYVPSDTRLDLAKALPQNNFYMSGQFNRDTNPFAFLAVVQGTNVIPGYFFVSYVYDLWNPVGENWTYVTTGPAPLSQVSTAENTSIIMLGQDGPSGLGPGTILVYTDGQWRNNGVPYTLDPTTRVYAYLSAQSSVFAPALSGPLRPPFDTVNISEGSPSSPSEAVPLVSRTPGTQFTVNGLDIWSRIKGAAGRFIKKVVVPAGQAALVTLMNPETRKVAQVALNAQNESTGDDGDRYSGYSKFSFSSLAANVRDKLSRALGGNILQMRDMLVSTKTLASISSAAAARAVGGNLNDDCQGFSQKTAEESENVVSRPVSQSFETPPREKFYYYTPDGRKINVRGSEDTTWRVMRFGTPANGYDVAPEVQAGFISEMVYEGDPPPVTQEFTAETYEQIADELVENGVNSGRGAVVVGAGILADVGESLSAQLQVQPVVNNYAGVNQTVNNEYHLIDLDLGTLRSLDPGQLAVVNERLGRGHTTDDDELLRDLPPPTRGFVRVYTA